MFWAWESDPHWPRGIELFTRIKVGYRVGSAGVLPAGSDLASPVRGRIPPIGGLDKASAQGHEAIIESFEERRGDHLHMKERVERFLFIGHW